MCIRDRNNGRYVFMGKNPEEVIKSKENGLVIEKEDGTTKELSGNPVDLDVYKRQYILYLWES